MFKCSLKISLYKPKPKIFLLYPACLLTLLFFMQIWLYSFTISYPKEALAFSPLEFNNLPNSLFFYKGCCMQQQYHNELKLRTNCDFEPISLSKNSLLGNFKIPTLNQRIKFNLFLN